MILALLCLVLGAFTMLLWDVYRIPQRVRDRFARGLVISTTITAGIVLITILLLAVKLNHMEANCHAHNDGHPSHSSP